ncbi:MAG TPA: copper resistance protein CopC [Pseudonocardiaceae bacterium]|jgi:copper transport protein
MRATLLVLVGVLVALFASAGPASAHAQLISTQPGSLGVLASVPGHVTLTFGERVQVTAGGVRVLAPDGSAVDNGRAGHITGRADTVGVAVTSTADGTYTVAWRVVSADSSPVSGVFTFSVGHPSSTAAVALPPAGSTTVGVLYWTSRVLGYASFALLFGAVGFVLLCWPEGAAERRIRRLIWGSWPVLLLSTVADALLQGPYGAGVGLGHLLDTDLFASTMALPLGTGLALRVSLLAIAVPLLSEVLAARRRAVLGWVCAALGTGLAVTWSISGHLISGSQSALALPVDALHLAAMGLWLGGLVVLWQAKPPAEAVQRFSRPAFACVAVLVLTGTYQSWRQLGGWLAFVDTEYGRLLLLKIAAVAGLLGAVWLSRRWVRSRAASPRYAVVAETAGAVVVLALTAALVNTQPARTHLPALPSTPDYNTIAFDTGGPRGAGTLKVKFRPLTTGPDVVSVTVLNPHGWRMDVAELDVEFVLPAREFSPLWATVQHVGMGTYRSAVKDISIAGSWQLVITVRTSDIDETSVAEPVTVTVAER